TRSWPTGGTCRESTRWEKVPVSRARKLPRGTISLERIAFWPQEFASHPAARLLLSPASRSPGRRYSAIPPPSDLSKAPRETAIVAHTRATALTGARLEDYLQLTRPRLSAMALLTVAIGAALASGGAPDWRVLTHTLIGAALVAAGASALNQLLECESDGLMYRTRARPLPSGRGRPGDALVFGLASAVGGRVLPGPH